MSKTTKGPRPGVIPSALGILVKNRREELRLHQTSLADKAGLNPITINRLENGMTRSVKADTLEKLAKALELPTEAVLEAATRPDPQGVPPTLDIRVDPEPPEELSLTITVKGPFLNKLLEALQKR